MFVSNVKQCIICTIFLSGKLLRINIYVSYLTDKLPSKLRRTERNYLLFNLLPRSMSISKYCMWLSKDNMKSLMDNCFIQIKWNFHDRIQYITHFLVVTIKSYDFMYLFYFDHVTVIQFDYGVYYILYIRWNAHTCYIHNTVCYKKYGCIQTKTI